MIGASDRASRPARDGDRKRRTLPEANEVHPTGAGEILVETKNRTKQQHDEAARQPHDDIVRRDIRDGRLRDAQGEKQKKQQKEEAAVSQRIVVNGLWKRIGKQEILKDVSFEARPGRVTAFLGPNGAGKSTTIRILLGLERATAGQTTIGGKRYAEFQAPLWIVGASFDGVGAPAELTAYRFLRILAASNGIPKSRIDEVLRMTDILHKRDSTIGSLSLGEGQRLGIAAALIGDPAYLILDEPTNGLDPSGIRWFRDFIRMQADAGKTVLLSSHILSEVEAVTDDVVILHQGRILARGELDAVRGNLSSLEDLFFHLTVGGVGSPVGAVDASAERKHLPPVQAEAREGASAWTTGGERRA